MLYASLFLSGLLLVVVNAVALRRKNPRVGLATLLSAAAIIPLFCMLSVLPLVNAILVTLAGLVCYSVGARPRWLLISSLAVTAAIYGVMGWTIGIREVREWDSLKAKYPMDSLAPRLAYEDRPQRGANTAKYDAGRLSSFETRGAHGTWNQEMRIRSLERLHAGAVEQFVNSEGFGMGRRIAIPGRRYLEITDSLTELNYDGPFPQPPNLYLPSEPESGSITVGSDPVVYDSHEMNLDTFFGRFDFGYARDRDHVAGFRPHQFRKEADAPPRWKVERLDLVGLLKYDEPVVYLSEHLPAMDELRDAPTRSLDAFENASLTALRGGEDLMVQDRPDRMRVLGSIRAVKQCLHCHHAERDELLGAFSYRLARDAVKN
jgi:hypothetical protein